VRKKILDFVLEEYKKEKKFPSVRKIKEFAGINTNRFYKIFPGGIKEVCETTEGKQLTEEQKKILQSFLEDIATYESLGAALGGFIKGVVGKHEKKE